MFLVQAYESGLLSYETNVTIPNEFLLISEYCALGFKIDFDNFSDCHLRRGFSQVANSSSAISSWESGRRLAFGRSKQDSKKIGWDTKVVSSLRDTGSRHSDRREF